MKGAATLKLVLSYLKRYWFLIIISLLFALCSVGLTLYIPIRIGDVIDAIDQGLEIAPILIEICILAGAVALIQWVLHPFPALKWFH